MSLQMHVVDDRALPLAPRCLAAHELDRARAFGSAARCARFLRGRVALRILLSRRMGLPARELPLDVAPGGALCVGGGGLWASLAHAGACSIVAVSDAGPVGVDAEPRRDVPDARIVAQDHFHADERAWLDEATEADRSDRFLRLWVRKEAVIKAAGAGFAMALPMWRVADPARGPEGMPRVRDGDGGNWQLHDGALHGGATGASLRWAVAARPGVRVQPPRMLELDPA